MNFIKRDIYPELIRHLEQKEITVILGPRQVGKTTLMKKLIAELVKKGNNYLLLNLDVERDMEFLNSQVALLNKMKLEFGEEAGFIFIDEIQRKENAGKFLKGIYDMELPYKFIVSGSGSLELKEKIIESLAGRKRVFELLPVSFTEFVNFKTNYKYKNRLDLLLDTERSLRNELFAEYLKFGGYPAIISASTNSEKFERLSEIFRSYIERDINTIINIDKPYEFEKLIEYMAHYSGYPISHSSISKNIGLSVHTIKKYLWYMEKTFMITSIRPFFTNPLKEITKSPVYYFIDLGMQNFLTGKWETKHYETYAAMHFQNFVHQLLHNAIRRTFSHRLNYWRTKSRQEIDFIIGNMVNPIPVEVKFTDLTKPKYPKAFISFIKKHNPTSAYLVNLSYEYEERTLDTTIKIIPYWKLENAIINN